MTTIAPSTIELEAVSGREVDREVIGGVDTHKDTHTAAAIDTAGRMLGSAEFPASTAGYAALVAWVRSFGRLVLIGWS